MIRLTFVFALCIANLFSMGCQHSGNSGINKNQKSGKLSSDTYQPNKWQRSVRDKDLFEILARNEPLLSKRGSEVTVLAYNLFCEMSLQNVLMICKALTAPEAVKGSRKVEFSAADSDALFALMSNLPIQKGEGGLATDMVLCRRVVIDSSGTKDQYNCNVSFPIGFVPHGRGVPMVEGED